MADTYCIIGASITLLKDKETKMKNWVKEKRDKCDSLAAKIMQLDDTVANSLTELSDYFYMHPDEFRSFMKDYKVAWEEL